MSSWLKFKNRRASLLIPGDHSRRINWIFFFISVLVHGLFFCGMVFFQDFKHSKPLLPVLQVDLVSFLPDSVFEEPGKSEEISKEQGGLDTVSPSVQKRHNTVNNGDKTDTVLDTASPSVQNRPKLQTLKPDISLKTKPKNLKDLMAQQEKKTKNIERTSVKEKPSKQSMDPEKVLATAREDLKKRVIDQDQDKISQALARLQKKVMAQGKTEQGQGRGVSTGYQKTGVNPIDLYKMVLGSKIEQNWVFNEMLARMDQHLEVRILIKVLKNGEIRDVIYETRSGNPYLDDSAKKAIKKANPLPQLPAGMHSYDVVVIFTPQGLK